MTFVVGIDLGTTNSVVAYVPIEEASAPISVLGIAQLTAPGTIEERPLLPSFLYLPVGGEFPQAALRLPWGASDDAMVGAFARERGGEVPDRLVSSAKSWLSHTRRRSHRADPAVGRAGRRARKLSPVDASRALPRAPPRGVGRRAPRRAARRAGRPGHGAGVVRCGRARAHRARRARGRARRRSRCSRSRRPRSTRGSRHAATAGARSCAAGDVVLVCDVGGGTTDFSLIEVREANGALALERIAVGDHILLGGDNMDLALAALVRAARSRSRARRSTPGSCARWCHAAAARRSSCSARRRRAGAAGRDPGPRRAS